jgi:crotonobetainyl-CoA:carnitine CoA-transferase CaiB-like acyl-CoA transferase
LQESQRSSPLTGIRIIDLTSVIMGSFATHILADMGADVIKIESEAGDSFRQYKPMRSNRMSGSFLNLHRNKRSIVLDLKRPEAKHALLKLVATADVFVHSLRPKTIEGLGLSYDAIRAVRPDIVYCGGHGFGSAGPYANKPAYDDLIEAGSGLSGLYQSLSGEPLYVPTVICDKLCGQAMAYAILAGLLQRQRGAGGQAIEVPMLETSIEFNLIEHMQGFAFEPPLGPPGFDRMLTPKRRPYRTKDGYACILPYSDRNWRDLYLFTGRMEFVDDPRFQSLAERVRNIDALYDMLSEEAPLRSTGEWVEFCDKVSIPCMPVLRFEELPDDPHVRAVKLFWIADHPTEGAYKVVRSPITFGNAPFEVRRHAPRLGEHTEEILAELDIRLAPGPEKPATSELRDEP